MIISNDVCLAAGLCPETHPNAFDNGNKCCKYVPLCDRVDTFLKYNGTDSECPIEKTEPCPKCSLQVKLRSDQNRISKSSLWLAIAYEIKEAKHMRIPFTLDILADYKIVIMGGRHYPQQAGQNYMQFLDSNGVATCDDFMTNGNLVMPFGGYSIMTAFSNGLLVVAGGKTTYHGANNRKFPKSNF